MKVRSNKFRTTPSTSETAMMCSPILICGCPGSGTSLVTKMLRHAGLFTGSDSGPPAARKYHESQCFKKYNIEFLIQTIEFPHAPKSAKQFNSHNQIMREKLAQLSRLVNRESLLNVYWGDSKARDQDQPWGWKDPRNSATALIWRSIFPELRTVIVCRNWQWRDRWMSGGSESGQWYRKKSTAELRRLYQNPIGLDEEKTLQVDIDQLTTNADFLRTVLSWCQLDPTPSEDLNSFLAQIGFEGAG